MYFQIIRSIRKKEGEMLVDGLTFGWINTEDGEKVALHAHDVWKIL